LKKAKPIKRLVSAVGKFLENYPYYVLLIIGASAWAVMAFHVRVKPSALEPEGDLTYNFLAELLGVTAEVSLILIFVNILLQRREEKKQNANREQICELLHFDLKEVIWRFNDSFQFGNTHPTFDFNELNKLKAENFRDDLQFLNTALTPEQLSGVLAYIRARRKLNYSINLAGNFINEQKKRDMIFAYVLAP